jgi:hypothetical protein
VSKKPASNKPKLKNGATLLLTACPRSLKALVDQLNQGDSIMATMMKK